MENRPMRPGRFGRLLLKIKGIALNLWRTARGYRLFRSRDFKCRLLIGAGLFSFMTALILGTITLFTYSPLKSAPFPYIPPPEGPEGYYVETSYAVVMLHFGEFVTPLDVEFYAGQSFIFKNILITDNSITESCFMYDKLRFVAKNPSDLKGLKVGDRFDIIGTCVGNNLESNDPWPIFNDCLFLPPGTVPFPLPGGPAPVTVY
jgi:hypothetical protein